jgi:hypothetical protein
MKRLTLLLLGLALGVASTASAQGLTMQMSNGWSFSFSGNVNAFWVFSSRDSSAVTGPSQTNSSIRTGLLPAFATFSASGKEAGLNLGVHFGFAPQINNAGGHDQFGAQIDMRQVYLTIGFKDGSQLLAGRELGLFQRQNILNDMTLFGVGAVGPFLDQGGGTTLGRIGYGYIYPNFNAQVTFSTPAKNSAQLSVGLFQPAAVPGFGVTSLPRVEAEVTVKPNMSGKNKAMIWVGGEWQTLKIAPGVDTSASAVGVTGGVKFDMSELSIVASYYYGSGIGGVTPIISGGTVVGAIGGLGFQAGAFTPQGDGRKFDGGYGQVTYTANKKTTVGASWGFTRIKFAGTSSSDGSDGVAAQWSSYTAGFYHQWTKSLKFVAEYTREVDARADQSNSNIGAVGFMLFY